MNCPRCGQSVDVNGLMCSRCGSIAKPKIVAHFPADDCGYCRDGTPHTHYREPVTVHEEWAGRGDH